MGPAEKEKFDLYAFGTLYATCQNKDRDAINKQYISGLHDVIVVRAVCTGGHATASASPKAGLLAKIPRIAYYAFGMMVKLTTNLIPELGLFNNARGTVVDIGWPAGSGYDPSNQPFFPVVIVDFRDYTGPPLLTEDPGGSYRTWVPIATKELRCDSQCCYYPLWTPALLAMHN